MVVDVFVVGVFCMLFFEINNELIVEILESIFFVVLFLLKKEEDEEDFLEKMIVM